MSASWFRNDVGDFLKLCAFRGTTTRMTTSQYSRSKEKRQIFRVRAQS
jgi:hypothetical protein